MIQKRSTSVAILVVTLAILAVGVFGFSSLRADQPVLVVFQVPKNYSGWLVVSWNCENGQRLADSIVNGRRYEPVFADDGTLCLVDDMPDSGYTVVGYRYVSGLNDGNDGDGVHLVASAFLRAGPTSVRPDAPGTTTIVPAIGGSTDQRYDIAWVEVRSVPNADDAAETFPKEELRLGDRCDLDRFMRERFAEPPTATTCGPIPIRQAEGISGQATDPLRVGRNPADVE